MRTIAVLSCSLFLLSCGKTTQQLPNPEKASGEYSHFLRTEGYCPHPDKLNFNVLTPELKLKEAGIVAIKEFVNWQTAGGSNTGDLCPLFGSFSQTKAWKTFHTTLLALLIEKGFYPNTQAGIRQAKAVIRKSIEGYINYQRAHVPDPADALNCGQYKRKQCDVVLNNCTRNCSALDWNFSIPNGNPHSRAEACMGSCYLNASNCYSKSLDHLLNDLFFNEYLNCHEKSEQACRTVGSLYGSYCSTLSQFGGGYGWWYPGFFSNSPRSQCYSRASQREKDCLLKYVPIF